MKRIVIIGGGFAGIYSVRNLLKCYKNKEEIEIVLISKNNFFLFTPLLHEVATGGINLENIVEPIRDIIRAKNFRFIECEVKKVDLKNKVVYIKDRKINYDFLVIAVGSKDNFYNVEGAEKFCLKLKTLEDARLIKNRLIGVLEQYVKYEGQDKNLLSFIIIGGGPTGVELVGEVCDFLEQIIKEDYKEIPLHGVKVFLVHSGKKLIPMFSEKSIIDSYNRLIKKNVKVLLNSNITKVFIDGVEIDNKEKISGKTIIWTGGVTPNIIETFPKVTDKNNYFVVDKFLNVNGYRDVYAIGDCALFYNKEDNKLVPALAQVAVDQARYVACNIKHRIGGSEEEEYYFKAKGYILSVGQKFATGDIYWIHKKGFFTWWLWRTIYLFKLIGFRNKIRTVVDWTIGLFSKRDTARI